MIEVKEAVQAAMRYTAELFAQEGVSDIRLEEVELSEDSATWHVTLSFLRKHKASSVSPALEELLHAGTVFGPQMDRDFKVLSVRADNGVVTAVKIRQLA
jgi:malate synthase